MILQTRITPPALKPGDAVGIVSPSWFGGEAFLPRARRGIAALERCGFEVRVGEHAFNNAGHVFVPDAAEVEPVLDTTANRIAITEAAVSGVTVAIG